jgi:hypothetical protein
MPESKLQHLERIKPTRIHDLSLPLLNGDTLFRYNGAKLAGFRSGFGNLRVATTAQALRISNPTNRTKLIAFLP